MKKYFSKECTNLSAAKYQLQCVIPYINNTCVSGAEKYHPQYTLSGVCGPYDIWTTYCVGVHGMCDCMKKCTVLTRCPSIITPHLHSMWSMNGPHTPLSVHLRVIFFGCPYTCVMYGIRQCNRFFSGAEISAFFAKIFFYIRVVILNSTLYSQIFVFDY